MFIKDGYESYVLKVFHPYFDPLSLPEAINDEVVENPLAHAPAACL